MASGGGEGKQARGRSGSARGSSRTASSSSRRRQKKKEKGKKKSKKDEKAKRAPAGESSLGESSDGQEPLFHPPDHFHKTKMCWTFLEGRCTLDRYCTAAHSEKEIVQPGEARRIWHARVEKRQRRAEKKRRIAEVEAASDPSGGNMGHPFFNWGPYPPEVMNQMMGMQGMPPGGHMAMPWGMPPGMPPGMPYPGGMQHPPMMQAGGAGAPNPEKKSKREEKSKKKKDRDEKKKKDKDKDKDKDKERAKDSSDHGEKEPEKGKDKKQKKDKEGKDAGEAKAKKQREATIGPRPG